MTHHMTPGEKPDIATVILLKFFERENNKPFSVVHWERDEQGRVVAITVS